MSKISKRKGFTLVEMLVVIGILGVLVASLIGALGGSTDSAYAAQCLSNMKNLAQACQSFGMASGYYPAAGSFEYFDKPEMNTRTRKVEMNYGERKGWISWDSRGTYPSETSSPGAYVSMFSTDDDITLYALTNGAVWKYVSESRKAYVCPTHGKKGHVNWSYIMNASFGWDATGGNFSYPYNAGYRSYGYLKGADRILLFAEVPFQGPGSWFPSGEGAGTDTDSVLQYAGCSQASTILGKGKQDGNENIGFNHKSGKNWIAHVVFADGHVEKFRCPSAGLSDSNLKDLTTWLCQGHDVSFNVKANVYEKLAD